MEINLGFPLAFVLTTFCLLATLTCFRHGQLSLEYNSHILHFKQMIFAIQISHKLTAMMMFSAACLANLMQIQGLCENCMVHS